MWFDCDAGSILQTASFCESSLYFRLRYSQTRQGSVAIPTSHLFQGSPLTSQDTKTGRRSSEAEQKAATAESGIETAAEDVEGGRTKGGIIIIKLDRKRFAGIESTAHKKALRKVCGRARECLRLSWSHRLCPSRCFSLHGTTRTNMGGYRQDSFACLLTHGCHHVLAAPSVVPAPP